MRETGCRLTPVDAAHHLVLGAARLVLGVALGAERLDGGRPAALADDGLLGIGRGSGDGRHDTFRYGSVPKVYRMTQGLKSVLA